MCSSAISDHIGLQIIYNLHLPTVAIIDVSPVRTTTILTISAVAVGSITGINTHSRLNNEAILKPKENENKHISNTGKHNDV